MTAEDGLVQSFKGPISAAGMDCQYVVLPTAWLTAWHTYTTLHSITEDTMDLSNSQFASLFVVSSLTGIECQAVENLTPGSA